MRTFKVILLILVTVAAQLSLAASPSSFSYEGVLTDSSGNPVNLSGRTVTFSVVNSSDCVIFSETSSTAGNSEGQISHAVGTGTNVFGAINSDLFNKAQTGQSACPVTAGEARFLKIEVSSLSVSATVSLSSVPYALEASQVGGFAANHLLRVANGGIPQSIAALTSTQAAELMNLVNGSTTLYISAASPSFSSAPTYSGAPAAGNQLTNKTYVDSAISTALTGYTLPVSVTAATHPKITYNNQGLVTGGTNLSEADIPNLSTAGKVSGNAINAGTIGGSTAINTTGTIESSVSVTAPTISGSTVKANNLRLYNGATNYIQIQAPTLGGIVNFTLPNGVGANGQFLKTDGSGNLTWDTPTGSGDASYAAKGLVQFDTNVATSGITVASGVASVNAGTGANQIVKLDGTGKLPAVDGSALTNISAGNVSAGVLSIARGGTNNGSLGVTAGGVAYGDGSKLMMSAAGTSGQALISTGAGAPAFGTLAVGGGGTGLTTGTSGGIPYFSAPNTMASSAALTANGVVLGGGAGAAPTSTGAGAAYSVLRVPSGGGTPAFGAIDLSQSAAVTGTLPVGSGGTGATSIAANRLVGTNGTGSALQAVTCSLNQVISFDGTGNYGCYNVSSIYSGFQDGGNTFTATATLGTNSNHNLDIETNDSVRMTIKNDGKVGIGTLTPNSALHVSGGIQLANDSDACIAAKSGTFRYTLSNTMEFCNGTAWTLLATGAAAPDASYAAKGQVQFDTDSATSGISVTSGVAKLSTTGVTANTYGSATKVGTFNVDAQGRITSAGDVSIAIPASQITQSGAANGEVLKWNGAAWAPAIDDGTTTDASYAAKGVVQFNTNAATSGITVISGVASVNTGTGANQIVKMGADSKLPAMDASNLTDLSAGNISSGTLPIARGGTNSTTALANNKVMVSSGGAIVEGVGFGATNTASTFVTRDASGNFAANAITNHSNILKGTTSGTLNMTVPATVTSYTLIWPSAVGAAGSFLTTDASGNLSWGSPAAIADASYAAKGAVQFDTNAATSGIIVASGVASVNTGLGANQIVKLGADSKLPAVDGSNLTNLSAGNISSGVLPIARGGTNNGSLGVTAGGVVYGDGSKLMMSAAGTSGQALISTGAAAPAFGTLGVSGGGTGLTSYTSGDLIYATGTTALAKLGVGGTGTILKSTGSAPAWSTLSAAGIFEKGGNSFGGDASLGTNDAFALVLKTGNTEKVRITKDGEVGIGIAPDVAGGDLLRVGGTTRINGRMIVNNNESGLAGDETNLTIQENTTAADGPPELNLASSRDWSTHLLINDTVGKIQFRTTYPSWETSAVIQAIASEGHTDTARGASLKFLTTQNSTLTPTDRMIITHDGKVGIGTTNPSSRLEITDAFTIKGLASVPTASPTGSGRIYFDSTSNKFKVSQNGSGWIDLILTNGSSLTNLNANNFSSGTLGISYGGTGNSSLGVTAGGMIYADGSKLMTTASGTSGQALISAGAGAPAFGTLGVGGGGTGLTTGISGGIPYFSASNTMASSAALTANGVVLGGGAGAAPTSTSAGVANSILRVPSGGGTPAFGPIDVSQSAAVTGTLSISNGGTGLSALPTDRILGTSGSGSIIPVTCNSGEVLTFFASGLWDCQYPHEMNLILKDGNSFATDLAIGTGDNFDLIFKTNNTNRMIIDQSGNVGIGATDPGTHNLSIAEGDKASIAITTYSTVTTKAPNLVLRKSNNTFESYATTPGSGHVLGTMDFQAHAGASAWVSGAKIEALQTGTYGIAGPPTSLGFFTTDGSFAPVERFTIRPNGYIGIGTASPSVKLEINDTSSNGSAILIPRAAGTFTGTVANGMIRYNTIANAFEFYQNGTWTNFQTLSDSRLKKNVTPIENGLNLVNKLNPVYFDWDRSNPRTDNLGNQHQVGFIAQEVEQVLPEVVNKGEDSYRSVEYGKIVSVVVAAVQEIYQKILGLHADINALKIENDILRKQTYQLESENTAIKSYLCKKDPDAPFCR